MIQPEGSVVHKIQVQYYTDTRLYGLRLFDKEGKKILVAGLIENPTYVHAAVKEFILNEGERWVGIESGTRGNKNGS